MPDQNKPAEKIDQHKSLEEIMRENLVSGFERALRNSARINTDQVERITKLLSQGYVSSQALLDVLRDESKADSDE